MEAGLLQYEGMVQTKTDFDILHNHKNMRFDIFPAMHYDREKDELKIMQDLSYHVIAFQDGEYVNCMRFDA